MKVFPLLSFALLSLFLNSCLILGGIAAAKAISSLGLTQDEQFFITPYEDLPYNLVVSGLEFSPDKLYGLFEAAN